MIALLSPMTALRAEASDSYALVNGAVYGADGWSSALAVSNGTIVAVGDEKSVRRALASDAKVVDLKGATVFPGFHDLHVHPAMAGALLSSCGFPQTADVVALRAALAACVKAAKPGAWIQGGQWTAAQFKPVEINRRTLDAIAPDNPVAIVDTSGHSLWVNSNALALAGITGATADPDGGIIEKDKAGEPTGLLRDSAAAIVRAVIPAATPEDVLSSLRKALAIMAQNGITALEDAIIRADNLGAYMALADAGELRQRVCGCLVWGHENPDFDRLLANRASYTRPHFKLDCVKVFMDGVPTESHTSAMLEPYAPSGSGQKGGAPDRGLLMIPPSVIDPLVTRLDREQVLVKFHAAGDWAVRAAMDAVEAARDANGTGGPHHQVGHLTFVNQDDFKRAPGLGVTLEFSPYLWFPQPIVTDIEAAVGKERNLRGWPVREGLETGALVIAGSDWPIVPSVNPWIAIETLVTRRVPGGGDEAYGVREAITLEQAIRLFTSNGAKAFGDPDGSGTITTGAPADLIVVDGNPFKMPITQVHAIKVLRTIVGGETVFDASANH